MPASASPVRIGRILAIPLAAFALLIGGVLSIALVAGAGPGCGGEATGSLSPKVPKRLVPIYIAAASRYRLGPRGPAILAAINWNETSFGTNMGTSSAGALGWMQFLPESWAAYGVDADDDGDKDPADPWDAIFAAARLLRAAGAPDDWRSAIFSYNHADWYVADVLADADRFAAPGAAQPSTACLPFAPNDAVASMLAEAGRLDAMRPHTSYVWGGSHGETPTPSNGPFDCSSAVSHLLQVGGFENPTMDTTLLVSWGEPGPGRYLTIFVKPYGPDAHTFIEFMPGITPPKERYWGTSGIAAPGKGPGFIAASLFSASYLGGFQLRHPAGL
jgi:hypothetical protein